MRPELYQLTNELVPATLDIDPSLNELEDILRRKRQGSFYTMDAIRGVGKPTSLASAKKTIVAKFAKVEQHFSSPHIMPHLAARAFDVLCQAYRLTDEDCADIHRLYVYLGFMEIPFGYHARNSTFHFEHSINKGQIRARAASFAIETYPFGTRYGKPEEANFETYVDRDRPTPLPTHISTTPAAAWNRMSGYVLHAAPEMPENAEAAHALVTEHKELAELAITDRSIHRFVIHPGVRFKNQFMDVRGNRVTGAGSDVAPETLQTLTPKLWARRLVA